MNTPRIMIAAVKSGSGKTTITCALLKQLIKRNYSLLSFKCGPDYIDPMFHEQVLHIPSENLDPYFLNEEQIKELFLKNQKENQLSVIEGVMGLYDGLGGIREEGSSYHLAKILKTPIILVADVHGMGRSIIPMLMGFLQYDTEKLIKGVILNRTSKAFSEMIRPEIEKELGIKVYGCFPQCKGLSLQSRHLGLVLPDELSELEEQLDKAGELLEENVDVDGIARLAKTAGSIEGASQNMTVKQKNKVRIAVAKDEAFCFYYKNNLRMLEEYGAEIVYFSPLHDNTLPDDIQGLLLGGGYPELYAKQLSENISMKNAVAAAINAKIPSLAECGGFMYLHERLIDDKNEAYKLAGVISADVKYTGKLVRFGYAEISEKEAHFLDRQTAIKGHEFHYYDSSANGSDCTAKKPVSLRKWDCIHASENHFWGFAHLYYASNESFVKHFIEQCEKRKQQ